MASPAASREWLTAGRAAAAAAAAASALHVVERPCSVTWHTHVMLHWQDLDISTEAGSEPVVCCCVDAAAIMLLCHGVGQLPMGTVDCVLQAGCSWLLQQQARRGHVRILTETGCCTTLEYKQAVGVLLR